MGSKHCCCYGYCPGLAISSVGPSRNELQRKFSKETHSHFVHTPWQQSTNTGLYRTRPASRQHSGPAWLHSSGHRFSTCFLAGRWTIRPLPHGEIHLSLSSGMKAELPACCFAMRERGSSKYSPGAEDRGPGYSPNSAQFTLSCSHGQFTTLLWASDSLYLSYGLIMPVYLTWPLRESEHLVVTMQVLHL